MSRRRIPTCTFCGQLATVRYSCPRFEIEVAGLTVKPSRQGWQACESCRPMVADLDHLGLVARAILALRRSGHHPDAATGASIRLGYAAFVALHDPEPETILSAGSRP